MAWKIKRLHTTKHEGCIKGQPIGSERAIALGNNALRRQERIQGGVCSFGFGFFFLVIYLFVCLFVCCCCFVRFVLFCFNLHSCW